jgi:hypothetical protein
MPDDYEKPIKLKANKIVIRLIEQKSKISQIYCDSHKDQVAIRFCRKHQQLICNTCLIERHIDHNQDCKSIVSQNILDFLQHHSDLLNSMNIRIIELKDEIYSFINQDRPFGASEFLKLASIINRFGTFDSILK